MGCTIEEKPCQGKKMKDFPWLSSKKSWVHLHLLDLMDNAFKLVIGPHFVEMLVIINFSMSPAC